MPFKCPFCGETFENFAKYRVHRDLCKEKYQRKERIRLRGLGQRPSTHWMWTP